VPIVADRTQIVPVTYRHHTAGTHPAPVTDVIAQPEVLVGTSGVLVTWTQIGQRRRQFVEERALLVLIRIMMMMLTMMFGLRQLIVLI